MAFALLLVSCGGNPPVAEPAEPAAGGFDPTAPALEAAEAPPLRYEIQAGDTLWDIAERHGTSAEAIVASNAIADPDDLTVGDVLTVPRAGDVGDASRTPPAR